jgi:hypothetical protein
MLEWRTAQSPKQLQPSIRQEVLYPVLRLMIRKTANNHGVEQLTLQFTLKSTYILALLLIMETD